MEFYHEPIMLRQCIEALNIRPDGIYVDGTTGGGGHSEQIAKHLSVGKLICIDRDLEALAYARERLKAYPNVSFVHQNFAALKDILAELQIDAIDGILLDLGVSSHQLDAAERGFSYMKDAPLDMRMDRTSSKSAYSVINEYDEKQLANIIYQYGEEKFSRRIAALICEQRAHQPIKTTLELVEIIDRAIPKSKRVKGSHPAKRTFQAIRIEVNGELSELSSYIKTIPDMMNSKGRIAIISFHSLEDRIVKHAFGELQNPCRCPSELPVCVCGKTSRGTVVFRKPVLPGLDEMERNTRARSAKLRAFEVL